LAWIITSVLVDDRTAPETSSRTVGTLVVLGDSVGVGLGDPIPDKGWRGFAPLLAEALAPAKLVNLSVNGARLGSVRRDQLPAAVAARPDVAIVLAGMNDTMRSDFDPARLHADLDRIITGLTETGALVVTIRYHDHGRVFRLPGPLRRVLTERIAELNALFDVVARRHDTRIVDLGELPGIYHKTAWSIDRLHPSELGHRILANALATRLAEAGLPAGEVSLVCAGGLVTSTWQHVGWLIVKGIPWLVSRSRDLVPHFTGVLLRTAFADHLAKRALTEEPEPASMTEQA
jgi:lysophospholipase L1-like esterase